MRAIGVVLIGAALLVGLVRTSAAFAQAEQPALEGKFRTGESVVVPADETVPHDLYASGSSVRVDGRVEGDLVAAGGRIQVTGTVTGDAMLAGGSTTLSGSVEGDVRAAAGNATVIGEVGEDLLAAGGQVRVDEQAQIGEDFVFGGGDVRSAGTIDGNVLGSAGTYVRTGTVAGEEQVRVAPEEEPPTAGERVLAAVGRYVTLLLVAALLLWLGPRLARRGADQVRRQPLQSLAIGIAGAVGGIVGSVVLIVVAVLLAVLFGTLTLEGLAGLVSVTGILGAVALVFGLVVGLAFLAHAVVGLWLGRLALRDDSSWGKALAAVALGLLVVVVLTTLPVIGGWVGLLIALLGLGALLLAVRQRGGGVPAPPMPAPPP